ncbi:MAG: hypothetical protein LBH92_02040 [Bacteroidales bacterium]|nr:hypothetical protein [Bacteroidales bacterium]
MKRVLQLFLVMFCMTGYIASVYAERVPERYLQKDAKQEIKNVTAACFPGAGFEMLEVNNVRSRINTSGDMWQNFAVGLAQYFIPANTTKTSLFAGALWIGGMDVNGQLKLAAQRFRQDGIDYWPGPLDINMASITEDVCAEWDRMFRISKAEVQEFISYTNSDNKDEDFPDYVRPQAIDEWPAHGKPELGQALYLAPFFDVDGNSIYDPEAGDYPYYDFDNVLCPLNYVDSIGWHPAPTMGTLNGTEQGGLLSDQVLKGDETLWWVFNDKGAPHTESKGQAIGLEIRAQSFAFATNDEINNMTFFSYEIINRSTFILTETYFAPWTDPDLGYARDDYIGCDVERGMGYCYNGTNVDGTGQPEAYGENPPAVGIDFFQGPYLDPNNFDNPAYKTASLKGPSFYYTGNLCEIVTSHDQLISVPWKTPEGTDTSAITLVKAEAINGVNFGNGIVDDERYGMRRFVYYNNTRDPVNGEPDKATDYYNYLRGIWRNNQRMTYGGNGTSGAIVADFMFPGTTDGCRWGVHGDPVGANEWSEKSENTDVDDRRFMQSAGPFTLQPGAVNYITFGVPWARASSGDAWASVVKLQEADDKCQALFDNCFKVLDGPDAPDMHFVELDKKLIIHLTNPMNQSNNYNEAYEELDNTIIEGDPYFRFEGYQIFQLANSEVGAEDLLDETKARLIRQCDIANGVNRIVNWEDDPVTGYSKPILRANGENKGIVHTFEITEDLFALGDNKSLINNKAYYYMAIAYAYNNWKEFDFNNTGVGGQMRPYLAGRKKSGGQSLSPIKAIPHKTINGIVLNSKYGDIPTVTRIEGQGNGGIWLDISDSLREVIGSMPPLEPGVLFGADRYPMVKEMQYERNAGPINVKVIDPLKVKPQNYKLVFHKGTVNPPISAPHETYNPMLHHGDFTYAYYIDEAKWYLQKENSDSLFFPDVPLNISKSSVLAQEIYRTNHEQLFIDLGISVTVTQTFHPGDYWLRMSGNGYLGSDAIFADTSKKWLTGVADMDIPGNPINWIRSGTYFDTRESNGNIRDNDYNISRRDQDTSQRAKEAKAMEAWDPMQNYEKIYDGTWAPYTLCASVSSVVWNPPLGEESLYGPAVSRKSKPNNFMTSVNSVDIVFTNDKSLWTRSVVVETGFYNDLNEGAREMFLPRKAPSIDKQGIQYGQPGCNEEEASVVSTEGMGWFPGYAVNIETGERLNIIYGENSYFAAHNGRDMKFNPTSTILDVAGNYYFGGMHYVYIMGHKIYYAEDETENPEPGLDPEDAKAGFPRELPAYDAGRRYMEIFRGITASPTPNLPDSIYGRDMVFGSCQWVGIPIPTLDFQDIWKHWYEGSNNAKYMEGTDFLLKIRVAKPYARYESEILTNPARKYGYKIPVDPHYASQIANDYWPMFEFSTKGMEPIYYDQVKSKSDLEEIRVVPNPYYAYSNYESSSIDNRVKISNLPRKCTVSIYNIGGTLVRQFSKDTPESTFLTGENSFVDWDLKNFAGIPISGGVYIVHVKAYDDNNKVIGEKVIKWFGVIRTVDLFTF